MLPDDSLNFGKARHIAAVDAHDAVARLELAVRRLAGDNHAHGRLKELHVLEKDRRIERNRKEQVHRRPREDDGDTLPESLRLKGSAPLLREDGLGVLALFEHFHEATEGEQSEAILRLFAADANDSRTEADR